MKIKFCGAAKIVTGSCILLEVRRKRYLIDCGMFQGTKDITRKNYEPFLFEPKRIHGVFLTHAHIDHSGLLPKLRQQGFKGKIYATSATIDLCKVMLEDSANIQIHDIEHENKRRLRQGLPPRSPLYDMEDVRSTIPLFKKVDYNQLIKINDNISVRYRDAGHIIGSAIIEVFVNEKNEEKKLVFSGDLGQWNIPILNNPTLIQDADYVFIESTYGDRLHENPGERDQKLLEYVDKIKEKGGKLMIPSFAVERTQEILYAFNKLIKKGKIPKMKIYLDSPLAIKTTEIFKKHRECFDEEALTKYKNPFSFPNLVYTPSVTESIKINDAKTPCIVIAGSGMCNAGRIRHHIKHGIWDPKNILLFVGYQAQGTLGRVILEGAKKVRLMGEEIVVKADVGKINGFSAHADYKELIKWLHGFTNDPKKIFIIHGEETSSRYFQRLLRDKGYKTHIPSIGEKTDL